MPVIAVSAGEWLALENLQELGKKPG